MNPHDEAILDASFFYDWDLVRAEQRYETDVRVAQNRAGKRVNAFNPPVDTRPFEDGPTVRYPNRTAVKH